MAWSSLTMDAIRDYLTMMKKANAKLGFASNGVAHFSRILETAEEFASFDLVGSLLLAKNEECEEKRCFDNCQRIAAKHNDLRYYEGYVAGPHVAEHAWLLDEDGVVLDPTVVLQPVLDGHVEGYLGVEIPIEFLIDDLLDNTKWESLLDKYIAQQITPHGD